MILNFEITNFGPIKDTVQLSFEPTISDDLDKYYQVEVGSFKKYSVLKLGLIYGANASGKSTVLNALDFLRFLVKKPLESKTDKINYQPFLFDETSASSNSQFFIEFIQNEIKYQYKVVFNRSYIVEEELFIFNPNKSVVFKRITDDEKRLAKINFGSKIKLSKESKSLLEANTLFNNTVLGGFLKTNIDAEELREVTDWFVFYLTRVFKPNEDFSSFILYLFEQDFVSQKSVIEVLKKADFNISNVSYKKKKDSLGMKNNTLRAIFEQAGYLNASDDLFQDSDLRFSHTVGAKSYSIPYNAESEGTRRYFQLSGLLAMMMRSKSIFVVDELEASLHPDLLKHFLLTFLVNCRHSQLIATTHNRELLMEKDILRNDAIWFTEKNESGSVELFSAADFDTSVIRKSSSVYNAYKIGKLGARPDLNDHFISLDDEEKK